MAKKSPLCSGTLIEFKYKDKDWKNGIIRNKTKSEMIIMIHKTLSKKKEMKLKMSDVITYLHIKKTFKISNIIYPQWILIHTEVQILNDKARTNEIAKIAHYRDNKSISFYFPKQKHEKKLLTIKQKNIKYINDYNIMTYCGLIISPIHSNDTMKQHHTETVENAFFMKFQIILNNLYDIPPEISQIIYQFTTKCMTMYNLSDFEKCATINDAKVWAANSMNVYGVEFVSNIDILCNGIEIYANFGKVKTYIILCINNKSYKGIMNDIYDQYDDKRRFIWEKQENILLNKSTICKIGFFVSDGASLTKYVNYNKDSPVIYGLNNFKWIKWQFMNRDKILSKWESERHVQSTWGGRVHHYILYEGRKPSNDWYPFIRLLL